MSWCGASPTSGVGVPQHRALISWVYKADCTYVCMHVCVTGEIPICSHPVYVFLSLLPLGEGPLAWCLQAELCLWERQRARPPRSGLFLFSPHFLQKLP